MKAVNTGHDRKDTIRKGIRLAKADFKGKAIAEAIGCSPQHLSTFMSGGPFGAEFTERAEQWLREVGYWEPGGPASYRVESLLAGKLRALADFIESTEIPVEFRIEEYAASIKTLFNGLDATVGRFRESTR